MTATPTAAAVRRRSAALAKSSTLDTPEQDTPRGYYGESRVAHTKNLLARSAVGSAARKLTPAVIAEMRRHYQVASCLLVQSMPLVRADWTIECDDPNIAEQLTSWYESIAFTVHRSMARAIVHGYSPNTLTWSYVESLRLLAPTEVRDLLPQTCRPLTDEAGTLDGFEQRVAGDVEQVDPLYALWVTEGYESGNYCGRSILDAALDPWADYAAIRAFHARYLERFGEPVVLARAPAGTSIVNLTEIQNVIEANAQANLVDGDPGYVRPPKPRVESNLDAALSVGQNLRHHSVVALPSSLAFAPDGKPSGYAWGLEFLEAKPGGGTDFIAALQETDKRIARGMFVPDLLQNNDSAVGSNALGQTHKDVWTDSTEGRLDDYSRQITEQLLDPVRRLNYGDSSPAARLVYAPLADAEQDRLWALITALVTKGSLPDVDVRQLAEDAGLPLLDAADVPTAAPAAAAAGASTDTGLAHDRGHTALALPDWRQPQADQPRGWARELNAREKRVGFAQLQGGMDAAEAATIRTLTEILDVEHDRVLKQLAAVLRKGTPADVLAALGTLEIKAEPKVAKSWADLMGAVGDLAVEQLRGELAAYADALPSATSATTRALFVAYATASAERAITALITDVRLRLLNAYTSGVVSKPALSAVAGQVFDEYQTSEARPGRLTTRMLTSKALNHARAAAVEAAGIPLAGAQYSAILDLKTCDLCKLQDEQVIAIESTDLARFTPPVHHNCRCVWVWITRDEADFTPTWRTPSKSLVDRFGGLVVG